MPGSVFYKRCVCVLYGCLHVRGPGPEAITGEVGRATPRRQRAISGFGGWRRPASWGPKPVTCLSNRLDAGNRQLAKANKGRNQARLSLVLSAGRRLRRSSTWPMANALAGRATLPATTTTPAGPASPQATPVCARGQAPLRNSPPKNPAYNFDQWSGAGDATRWSVDWGAGHVLHQ